MPYCQSCGHIKPAKACISPFMCASCAELPPAALSATAKATALREFRQRARRLTAPRLKECAECLTTKAGRAFRHNSAAPDGLAPACKTCTRARDALVRAGLSDQWPALRDTLRARRSI